MAYGYQGQNLLRRGLTVRCAVDAAPPVGTGENVVGHVRGQIALVPVGRTVLARGQLEVTIQLRCARCLRAHQVKLTIDVERECTLQQIDDPQAYAEVDDGLPPVPILNAGEIDLSELVRQLIVINAPARSLCQPDCKGLCPQCGADLNEGPCECEVEEVDPRLAPLKALLEDT